MPVRGKQSPNLPAVPAGVDASTKAFLTAVKETIETMQGKRRNTALKAVVTFEDLQKMGLKVSQKGVGTDAEYDFSRIVRGDSVPNPPRDLAVTSMVVSNKLTWTNPSYNSDLSHVEIYCAFGSQSISDAIRVGIYSFPSKENYKAIGEFIHSGLNTKASHTYWLRTQNWPGNHSPWEPNNGGRVVPADSSATINDLLSSLTDDNKYDTIHRVIADSFQVLQPSAGLESPVPVFVVGTVDGQTAIGVNGDMFVDGAILTKHLDGDIINGAFLSASAQIQLGVDGLFRFMEGAKIFGGDGNFLLDTTGGVTRLMMGPNGALDVNGNVAVGKDYMLMTGSDITYYRWFGGAHREYKSLKRMEQGWVSNGVWLTLPGYWVTPPKIQLSPRNLKTFDKDNNTVHQSLNMEVTDIEEVSGTPNVYRFMSNARLVIAAGTVDFDVLLSKSEDQDGVAAQTASYTTPPYCSACTIDYEFKANKPTDTVGIWHKRTAILSVYVDGVVEDTRSITTSSTGYYPGSISISGLTASATGHSVYLKLSATDDGANTFPASMSYDTQEASSLNNTLSGVWIGQSVHSDSFSIPAASTPSDGAWELYQIDISGNLTNTHTVTNDFVAKVSIGGVTVTCSGAAGTATFSGTGTTSLTSSPTSGSLSHSTNSYMTNTATLNSVGYTAYWRKGTDALLTKVEFTSISVTLTGANTLAEGTVNYMAISEE
ncbi:hypothetical protein SYK_06590 [Pseudodesulfovibrio nedwellii]|uniref:Uncharacterized protein n=1 Tax=Pseudodesulfovibrio nedwellii TaxID=2973072 RepID=A0ABN6S034_9BACT|nr:hypothetical protein [Pseudodesulfovibrio nedwellii]BDQ36299.1 hypothetical protein SYK_06590 [Pseudodesulfovibrio nedwellii]